LVIRKVLINKENCMKTNKLFGMVVLAISIMLAFSFTACGGGGDDNNGGQGTAPTITTTSLQGGTVGTAYSQTLTASGDTPITWNKESGTLPDGLTLSTAGVISGNPTTANTFTFTVKATNAAGSKTKSLSITIASGSKVVDSNLIGKWEWEKLIFANGTQANLPSQGITTGGYVYTANNFSIYQNGTLTVTNAIYTENNKVYFTSDNLARSTYSISGTTLTINTDAAYGGGGVIAKKVTSFSWESGGGQLAYTLNNTSTAYSVSKGTVTSGNVVIPATYNNLPVNYISSNAFSDTSITGVTIPNSIRQIGNSAFADCTSLTSISITNGVEVIGTSAFSRCTNLVSITIPASVTAFGDGALDNCKKLTSITVDGSNTLLSAEGGILYNKTKSTLLAYPSATGSVTVANSVTQIYYAAFRQTSVSGITLPNNVTTIGNSAFQSCESLNTVTLSNNLTTIGQGAFGYSSNITSITIPASVTSVGASAFAGWTASQTINIQGSTTGWDSGWRNNCNAVVTP
jgi:hypothetical protein